MTSVPIVRPTWRETFMDIASLLSRRSYDSNTKHGSVLVDPHNHILSTGYNSFPKGMPDEILPNTRTPDGVKYLWMIHSEINAIVNLTRDPFLYNEGITLYCTGKPCCQCLGALINANVKTIFSLANSGWSKTEQEQHVFDDMMKYSGIKYIEI